MYRRNTFSTTDYRESHRNTPPRCTGRETRPLRNRFLFELVQRVILIGNRIAVGGLDGFDIPCIVVGIGIRFAVVDVMFHTG